MIITVKIYRYIYTGKIYSLFKFPIKPQTPNNPFFRVGGKPQNVSKGTLDGPNNIF